NNDLYLLPARYTSVGATAAATEARSAILRRGNINHQFGTDSFDITALYQKFGQTYDWFNDLNADGAVNQGDVDTLVHTIFGTEYGDANLDQSVNALDFNALASNFGHTGAAWSSSASSPCASAPCCRRSITRARPRRPPRVSATFGRWSSRQLCSPMTRGDTCRPVHRMTPTAPVMPWSSSRIPAGGNSYIAR